MDLQPEMRDLLMRNGMQAHVVSNGSGYQPVSYTHLPDDISTVLARQNIEAATGSFGANHPTANEYTMKYRGRLSGAEELGELVRFPDGVSNRTEAIQHRIETAGLRRKVRKNQTKAIRVMLNGTHEQMMKIANDGKLDSWIDANLKWLRETFGNENLVSCVLHMDEKTPHLHATVVPIVTGERIRRKREGEKKYETKSGPRLSADDVTVSYTHLDVYKRQGKLLPFKPIHQYNLGIRELLKHCGIDRMVTILDTQMCIRDRTSSSPSYQAANCPGVIPR